MGICNIGVGCDEKRSPVLANFRLEAPDHRIDCKLRLISHDAIEVVNKLVVVVLWDGEAGVNDMLDVRLIDEFSFKTIHNHRETIPFKFLD